MSTRPSVLSGTDHTRRRTDRVALYGIYGISAAVFLVVLFLNRLPQAEQVPGFARYLPTFNATVNTVCTALLIISFVCIRRGKVNAHKVLNLTTFGLSALFLISYVLYHSFGIEMRYPADNPFRSLYLAILVSHIVLAAVVLPLVLFAFYYALTGRIGRHRRVVRFAYPIWLYVTITGVVVYLMIRPYYPF